MSSEFTEEEMTGVHGLAKALQAWCFPPEGTKRPSMLVVLKVHGLKGKETLYRKLAIIDTNPLLPTYCGVKQLLEIKRTLLRWKRDNPQGPRYMSHAAFKLFISFVDSRCARKDPLSKQEARDCAKRIKQVVDHQPGCSEPSDDWLEHLCQRGKGQVFAHKTASTKDKKRSDTENVDALAAMYRKLGEVIARGNYKPHQIIAFDETGFVVDRLALLHRKYFVLKGQQAVRHTKTSSDQHVTVGTITCLSGDPIPPVTVFQGKKPLAHALEHAPDGTSAAMTENGYLVKVLQSSVYAHIVRTHQPDNLTRGNQ